MDIGDIEWRCFCGHTNPDFDERCNGCGQERYPEEGGVNVTKLVTDDFVAAFRTDEDCTGIMARLCVLFYPEGLPVGVDPEDERVRQVIARIQRVQGITSVNPAQSTRLEKEKHPERFCPKCLWRIVTTKGPNPCRKHPVPEVATK